MEGGAIEPVLIGGKVEDGEGIGGEFLEGFGFAAGSGEALDAVVGEAEGAIEGGTAEEGLEADGFVLLGGWGGGCSGDAGIVGAEDGIGEDGEFFGGGGAVREVLALGGDGGGGWGVDDFVLGDEGGVSRTLSEVEGWGFDFAHPAFDFAYSTFNFTYSTFDFAYSTGEGGEGDVVECAVGDDEEAFALDFVGDGGEDLVVEGLAVGLNVSEDGLGAGLGIGGLGAVSRTDDALIEFCGVLFDLGLGGEDVGFVAVFGDQPEVALVGVEAVLQ